MRKIEQRVGRLEGERTSGMVVVLRKPGQTQIDAVAEYRAANPNGPALVVALEESCARL